MSRSLNSQTRYQDHSLFQEARDLRREGYYLEAEEVESSRSHKHIPRYGNNRKSVARQKEIARRQNRRTNNRNTLADLWS